jgi:ABC-type amino acid transport substrate-binding protein
VVEGFFHQEFLQLNYPDVQLVLEKDTLTSLFSVLAGRADAAVGPLPTVKYLLDNKPLIGLQMVGAEMIQEERSGLSIAVRKDWLVLRDILQKGLQALDEGEMLALNQKWLGAQSTQVTSEDASGLTLEERAWVSDHPVIRVHNEMNWPPFNFNENGEPRGFSIDFMNLVTSRVGLQVEYVSGPSWDEFMGQVRTGELDVMLDIAPTKDRTEYLNFTDQYVGTAAAVVVKDPTLQLKSIEDLHGKRLAIPKGFFSEE